MSKVKGEQPSGFSEEPLMGSAFGRALERGQAAGVRVAGELADQRRARIASLKQALGERAAQRATKAKAPLREAVREAVQAKTPLVERVAVKLNGHARLELPNHRPVPKPEMPEKAHIETEIVAGETTEREQRAFANARYLESLGAAPKKEARAFLEKQGKEEDEVLAEGDFEEGVELDPFVYKESLAVAGERAITDSSMTPDEVALMTEEYAEYAGTHEQGQ